MMSLIDNYGLEKLWIKLCNALRLEERLVRCDRT